MTGQAPSAHERLQDLRFLHMATQLEAMLEGLERAFEKHIPEGAVRTALRPIFEDGPGHARLRQAYQDLNRDVALRSGEVSATGLLEAILACERSAHEFYSSNRALLSDPALQQLFAALAQEESEHIHCVEEAIRLQRFVG